MNYGNLVVLALAAVMSACQANTSSASSRASADARASEQPPATKDSIPALEAQLQDGMPYIDLRTTAVEAGWLPVLDPACKQNVGGEARICGELFELESCSSDGRCLMWFGHQPSATLLRVDAMGDYTAWRLQGDAAKLHVRSWEFTPASAASTTAQVSCPSQDFEQYLQVFARDDRIESAYTAPLVEVAQLIETDAGFRAQQILVRRADYDGFSLAHDDEGFHVVDAAGAVDPEPVSLEVEAESADSRLVSYAYGLSEGNSYHFRKEAGCWYLAGDPEPPSP